MTSALKQQVITKLRTQYVRITTNVICELLSVKIYRMKMSIVHLSAYIIFEMLLVLCQLPILCVFSVLGNC